MNKITAEHLARRACVYIRQSTPGQVHHNLESQRRQYGLIDRARAIRGQSDDPVGQLLFTLGAALLFIYPRGIERNMPPDLLNSRKRIHV